MATLIQATDDAHSYCKKKKPPILEEQLLQMTDILVLLIYHNTQNLYLESSTFSNKKYATRCKQNKLFDKSKLAAYQHFWKCEEFCMWYP